MSETLIRDLQALVGAGHAFGAADPRAAIYTQLFGLEPASVPEYVAVARPDSVESLQSVVRAAAGEGMSLWSVPNAAGNDARLGEPGIPGLVIDLRRMNRILDVDVNSACALVEPGVSYRQLHVHLVKNGIAMWVDSDRDADHSIAGSICSRQFGFTPYADHLQMQCGMEVVLADGEVLRTGMGALPGNNTWQLFKYSFGPYLDGLFTQSGLALVAKIGLWIMPVPPRYRPFMVTLPDQPALEQAVEVLRPLKIGGVIGNTVTVATAALDAAESGPRGDYQAGGRLDPAKLMRGQERGGWDLYGALYGAPGNMELSWQVVQDSFHAIAGARLFTAGERAQDPAWRMRQDLMGGRIPAQPRDLASWGGPQCMRLTAAAPMEGQHAARMGQIASRIQAAKGFDSLHEFVLTSRTLLMHVHLPYDRGNASTFDNALAAADLLLKELTGAGYGIVDESVELRRLADRHTGGSDLAALLQRLQRGLAPRAGAASG
ncbi:MAG: FAD-dependent oxidoreductase [Gammaproteobacteria bacterium]|nr:FAD-dependent oxidoreductase [Gammaproteobacteria bacterium]